MGNYIQILAFITIGVVLLWFGYSLLIGQVSGIRLGFLNLKKRKKNRPQRGSPGDPQVCPVCSTILHKDYLVKTHVFPSLNGGKDRFMHIKGCIFCIDGDIPRLCPVCGEHLKPGDILLARMFERPRRNHVHVIGCSICKPVGGLSG